MSTNYIVDPKIKLEISEALGFRGGDLRGDEGRSVSYCSGTTGESTYVEVIGNGCGVRLTELSASRYELMTWGGGGRVVQTITNGQIEPSEGLEISRERILAAPTALTLARSALA